MKIVSTLGSFKNLVYGLVCPDMVIKEQHSLFCGVDDQEVDFRQVLS